MKKKSVAIIGMGAKGLYSFERLLAHLAALSTPMNIDLYLIHRDSLFGVSPIYDVNLPDYIILNNSVGDINIWTENDPPPVVDKPLNFIDWYKQRYPEAKPLCGHEYLPRARVGEYLHHGFRQLCRHVPTGTRLSCCHGEVKNIKRCGARYQLEIVTSDGAEQRNIDTDKILLSTGHSSLKFSQAEMRYQRFSQQYLKTRFIPFVYPLEKNLRNIPAGETVIMKGIGLTFIDALLELTEGRGGRFVREEKGSLCYRRSGEEPEKVFPFSLSGLPMVPKACDLPITLRSLVFCNLDKLGEMRLQAEHGQLDFDRQLLPLVKLEMQRIYYLVLMTRCDASGQWLKKLNACENNAEKLLETVAAFLKSYPGESPFDFSAILEPRKGRVFSSAEEYKNFIKNYMDREITRAKSGHGGSASRAAMDIWHEVRYALGEMAVQNNGLLPYSHKRLKEKYFPLFKRVVFGPPVENMEKLLALARAEIVDFSVAINPEVRLNKNGDFQLNCTRSSRMKAACSVKSKIMVDARYPDVDIKNDSSPLIRNLMKNGIIRPHVNHAKKPTMKNEVECYRTGAMDMSAQGQFVVGRDTSINRDIAVVGIPTEYNQLGNLNIVVDSFCGAWAKQLLKQLDFDSIRTNSKCG